MGKPFLAPGGTQIEFRQHRQNVGHIAGDGEIDRVDPPGIAWVDVYLRNLLFPGTYQRGIAEPSGRRAIPTPSRPLNGV